MKLKVRRTLMIAVAAGSATAQAQTVVVPGANAAVAGNQGLNTVIRDSGNPRTAQLLIDASELASVPPGSLINGIEFRLWVGATVPYPTSDATWTNYDIYCGPSVTPSTGTGTFAANAAGPLTQVRSGPLTISANSFGSGGSPNTWGQVIAFSTPYVYSGGHLLVEIRHPGSNIVHVAANSHFADAIDAATSANRSFTAVGNTATSGAAASYTISRLTYTPGGPVGACCLTSGTTNCLVTTSSACGTQGGTYQGDGSTCATANCPPLPTGACCADTGCSVVTAAACTAAGGTYAGNNITCAAANCPPATAWAETGEAGETPGTAQIVLGSGSLNAIRGNIASDTDMYQILICDEANFTASTVGGTTWDTQLWLFDTSGLGISHCDDAVGLQSTLTSLFVNANGLYLLAISAYDRDALDSGGQALWLDTPFLSERAPDGPGAANPVSSWDSPVGSGAYSIALTGSCFVSGSFGACCLGAPSYSCVVTDSAGCAAQGGTYAGNGVTCPAANCPPPPTGACCTFSGSCSVVTQAACNSSGGVYQGNGSVCGNCPQPYAEVGEAGDLPGTAAVVSGSGALIGITGTLGVGDADMYRINVCNASGFSATTQGLTTVDTQLFMFRPDGMGVTANDDTPPGGLGLHSTIGSSIIGPAGNGEYYLAISQFDKDPYGATTVQEIWLDLPYAVERAPDGPAAGEPIGSWNTTTGAGGTYGIRLTGACYIGGCYANCDGSTGNPALTANDFQCFINKYAANDPYANCDGSTGNPALTANDFQCFINKYAGGCP